MPPLPASRYSSVADYYAAFSTADILASSGLEESFTFKLHPPPISKSTSLHHVSCRDKAKWHIASTVDPKFAHKALAVLDVVLEEEEHSHVLLTVSDKGRAFLSCSSCQMSIECASMGYMTFSRFKTSLDAWDKEENTINKHWTSQFQYLFQQNAYSPTVFS
jgi:hypothetical protein